MPAPLSRADLLAQGDAIFEGRVIAPAQASEPPLDAGYRERLDGLEARIDALKLDREVRFDVLRSWKGASARAVVWTAPVGSACGYPFEVGHTYLVFARRGADGALWTSICGRTRPADEAAADLALLDAYAAPPRKPAVAPARAGCAGCAVEPHEGTGTLVGLALAFGAMLCRRCRS